MDRKIILNQYLYSLCERGAHDPHINIFSQRPLPLISYSHYISYYARAFEAELSSSIIAICVREQPFIRGISQ